MAEVTQLQPFVFKNSWQLDLQGGSLDVEGHFLSKEKDDMNMENREQIAVDSTKKMSMM